MIKQTEFTSALNRVVDIKMKAIDRLVMEVVKPMSDVGNPEKVMGKPYEEWTPQDLNLAIQIYGAGKDTPLTRLIFNKEFASLQQLEQEV